MRFTRDFHPKSGSCFVIMPFGVKKLSTGEDFDWDDHWEEVIKPTIEESDMEPLRADKIYGTQPLMDRIWKGIQEAEVIVADLTGRSPNVLYELGLAHVIGKRIVLLTMDSDDVPVDLATLVRIDYSTAGSEILKFTRKLKKNLEAAKNELAEEISFIPIIGVGKERISARVLQVTSEFAIVEAQDGRRGLLNSNDYSWTWRHVDLTKFLSEGQQIDGAFIVVKGETKYSLRAVTENPWPRLEADLEAGKDILQTTVKAVVPGTGLFAPVRYEIDGLVPQSSLPAGMSLVVGSQIEVSIVRIDAKKKEVGLKFLRELSSPSSISTQGTVEWGPYVVGDKFEAKIVHQDPSKGFLLADLPDGCTALLHEKEMASNLYDMFRTNRLETGSKIPVEILFVDQYKKRLTLREVISGDNPE